MRSPESTTIIVLSHHRWVWEARGTVHQRPHHIAEEFSRRGYNVCYVEHPWWSAEGAAPHMAEVHRSENLRVIRPIVYPQNHRLPVVSARNKQAVRVALQQYFEEHGFCTAIVWYYDPMYRYISGVIGQQLVVYDCMDVHAAFKRAPRSLIDQEDALLTEADLVFTGGRSIDEAIRGRNLARACYREDSGVHVEHFSKARDSRTVIPEDIASLPAPVIGYFGVIDERMDYQALAYMAEHRQEWSFVLIGPVRKVRKADLPKARNIHLLGPKPYSDLPAYLKGFTVATVLFADNDATRHISPTKVPEYMAGGKPVVSGPVPDIVANFGELVRIARSPEEWLHHVDDVVTDFPAAVAAKAAATAEAYAWERIVDRMEGHMIAALARRAS